MSKVLDRIVWSRDPTMQSLKIQSLQSFHAKILLGYETARILLKIFLPLQFQTPILSWWQLLIAVGKAQQPSFSSNLRSNPPTSLTLTLIEFSFLVGGFAATLIFPCKFMKETENTSLRRIDWIHQYCFLVYWTLMLAELIEVPCSRKNPIQFRPNTPTKHKCFWPFLPTDILFVDWPFLLIGLLFVLLLVSGMAWWKAFSALDHRSLDPGSCYLLLSMIVSKNDSQGMES